MNKKVGEQEAISILIQQVGDFVKAAREVNQDHEARIRGLETATLEIKNLLTKLDGKIDTGISVLEGKMNTEVGVINARITSQGILQTGLSSILSAIAAALGIGSK